MIGGSRTCFARFPLPGLSYPVSFSVGIGAGQLRLSQGDFHPLCFSVSAKMLWHRLPARPAQDGTPSLDGSSGIRIEFPATQRRVTPGKHHCPAAVHYRRRAFARKRPTQLLQPCSITSSGGLRFVSFGLPRFACRGLRLSSLSVTDFTLI